MKRSQGDARWQRDFFAYAEALQDCREHTAAGWQCHEAGAHDEARAELALADEAKERADMLEHALRDL